MVWQVIEALRVVFFAMKSFNDTDDSIECEEIPSVVEKLWETLGCPRGDALERKAHWNKV